MSDRLDLLARRILSQRLVSIANTMSQQAKSEGLDIEVSSDMPSGSSGAEGSLRLSGQGLMRAQYGDRGTAPTGLISRLIQATAQNRRSS